MANKTEFSRLVFKRSTVTGVEPTINTGDTIDNTWLDTDILIGEGFLNVFDDRLWFRTNNGIQELSFSGVSDNYTTAATISNNTVFFDTIDSLSAYSIDLSSITPTGDTFTTGATITDNKMFFDRTDALSAYSVSLSGITGDYLPTTGGTMTGDITMTGGTINSTGGIEIDFNTFGSSNGFSVTTDSGGFGESLLYLGPTPFGAELSSYDSKVYSYSQTTTQLDSNGSIYLNAYNEYVKLRGHDIIIDDANNFSGTSLYNLGIDATGRLTTGDTLDTSIFLKLTGGTMTGPFSATSIFISDTTGGASTGYIGIDADGQLVNASAPTITGDTVVENLSATTISILNSGATTRDFLDYSGNLINTGVTNSNIFAGSGNTISKDLRNVFISGVDLSAVTNDTSYFSNINIGAGVALDNDEDATVIAVDSDGKVVTKTVSTPTAGNYIDITGSTVVSLTGTPMDISVAVSDETTALTGGSNKITIYAPYDFMITDIRWSLTTSGSTKGNYDIHVNDVTIYSTKPSIDANEFLSSTAASPGVITGTTISQDDKITIDVDGAGTNSTGLKAYILGIRTL